MKRFFAVAALLAIVGTFTVACGKKENSSSVTTTTTTVTTTTGDKIGVPECDEYVAKYTACINSKVPEATRGTFQQAYTQMVQQWKAAASTDAGKSALATGCKAALDGAKQSMQAFGCSW